MIKISIKSIAFKNKKHDALTTMLENTQKEWGFWPVLIGGAICASWRCVSCVKAVAVGTFVDKRQSYAMRENVGYVNE